MRIISKKLRDSARGQECTLRAEGCNYNPDTVVMAHVPCGHKGIGMKGPDNIAIFACSACHDLLDGRRPGELDPWDVIRALAETQIYWIENKLLTVAK